ncbi:unnamed protein product [Owenia fusiformis]|uniref:Uncharacterized protein n=1 Tax=Owenia fusiformis TaxID=6347 RepID=A0A8J1TRE1_OWEFU|nr:unnamed protein product [Owenia fusiformis]
MLESIMLDFVIIFIFALLLLGTVIFMYRRSGKFRTTIPGMDPIDSREGNLPDIAKAGSLHEFLSLLHERYGKIAHFWMGPRFVVSIASAELFKQHLKVFDRPPELFRPYEPLFGSNSIAYANGADGRARRKLYDASYGHGIVMNNYLGIFNKLSNEVSAKWNTMLDEQHIPLRDQMFAFAIKSITITSFGDYFHDDEQVLEFRKAYDTCMDEMERRLTEGAPEPDSLEEKNFKKALNIMHSTIKKIVEIRRDNPLKSEDDHIFLDTLLEAGIPESQLIDDSISFTVAGFHTSGLFLTWLFYFLALHQDVQTKVYDELLKVLGPNGKISADNINDLQYGRQVQDETLRCSVLAPWTARYQHMDVELGGHTIPAETPVILALGVSLQDEEYWPEPTKFDPDRFSPENSKLRPDMAFQPFGFAGKRKCPGYRFSYIEVQVLVAEILRKFRIKLVEGQVVMPVYGFVTNPKEEIWVTLEKRGNEE